MFHRWTMRQVNWYFDFISPYSYFGLFELERLGRDVSELEDPSPQLNTY